MGLKSKNAFLIQVQKISFWVHGIKLHCVAIKESRDSWKVREGETRLLHSG